LPSGKDESYYEVTVYHSTGKRVFIFDVYNANAPRNQSTQIHFQVDNSATENAFGYPYKVTIRLGSRRSDLTGPISATLTNFAVQANYCPNGVGETGCDANSERQRKIFIMEPSSSAKISNYDQSPAIIPVKPMNKWAS